MGPSSSGIQEFSPGAAPATRAGRAVPRWRWVIPFAGLSYAVLVMAGVMAARSSRYTDEVMCGRGRFVALLKSRNGQIDARVIDVSRPLPGLDTSGNPPPGWRYRATDRWDYRSYDPT